MGENVRALKFLLVTVSLACATSLAAQPAPQRTGTGGLTTARVTSDMRWRMIGPFRGGRTRALAGVATQPSVFYIGPVNGAVWKTEDAGNTWYSSFDEQPTQWCCQSNGNLSPLGRNGPNPSLALAHDLPPLSQGG